MKIKNIVLYILFFYTINFYSQNKDSIVNVIRENQKEYFERSEKHLKNDNTYGALELYHSIWSLSNALHEYSGIPLYSDSTFAYIENVSKKRIDSLLSIFHNKELKKWKGKWKLMQLQEKAGLIYSYKYIEITDDKILFYDESLDTSSRVEEIKIAPYRHPYTGFVSEYYKGVEFKNGEIWEFTVEEKTGEKRLFPFIRRIEDGTEVRIIDDSGMWEVPEELAQKEYRTYYTLIE